VNFVRGDAQNLPFPDQSFDAVINIESSAHYPSLARFLAEVARVLLPRRASSVRRLSTPQGIAAWETTLANAPLRKLSQRVINEEVLRAMKTTSRQRLEVIDRRMPPILRGLVRWLVNARMAGTYQELCSGRLSYRMYCFI
jgi:ubiquinone/menaquinone biosynthesis C-methylase UbiE